MRREKDLEDIHIFTSIEEVCLQKEETDQDCGAEYQREGVVRAGGSSEYSEEMANELLGTVQWIK